MMPIVLPVYVDKLPCDGHCDYDLLMCLLYSTNVSLCFPWPPLGWENARASMSSLPLDILSLKLLMLHSLKYHCRVIFLKIRIILLNLIN
jgi:hypothetical protein